MKLLIDNSAHISDLQEMNDQLVKNLKLDGYSESKARQLVGQRLYARRLADPLI